MTTLSQVEQLQLEMINRARLDPLAEANRLGIGLNQFIDNGTVLTGDPKQPLAASSALSNVARAHATAINTSHVMDKGQSNDGHNGAGDGVANDRIKAGGFTPATWSENFAVRGTTGALTDAQIATMTTAMHDSLFIDDPANSSGTHGGHRITMLQGDVKQIGIGQVTGSYTTEVTFSTGEKKVMPVNGTFLVENFAATPANTSFLSGAVYNDKNGDHFYGIGEAVKGVTATVKTAGGALVNSDITGDGGGWTVAENFGTFTVTFSGGGLAAPVSATVEAGSLNAKVDLVNGKEIDSTANTTLGTGAADLRLLGISSINGTGNSAANVITGNKGNNVLNGKGGNDTIDGGDGIDTAVFNDIQANYQIKLLGGGMARITSAVDGTDTIKNIEFLDFKDNKHVAFSSLHDTATNTAPVVTGKSFNVDTHATVSLASMFAATDVDGNATITRYAFMDGGTASGKIVVNGVAKPAGEWIMVDAKDLASVKYAAGASVDSEKISIKAFDGQAWSSVVDITAKTTARAVEDFGANGKSDILFHNEKTGSLMMWQMDGSHINLAKEIGFKASSWHVAGEGDFGGDGKADILWQNSNGSLTLWQMNGSKIVSSTDIAGKGANWHVAAVADFNADGKADILWQSDAGSVALWEMNGAKAIAKESVQKLNANWLIEDAADFSGNGKADILLHNNKTGDVAIRLMDGSNVTVSKTVANVDSSWHYAGAGDLNGDGNDDIVWHNDNGSVRVWQMDGTKIVSDKVIDGKTSAWDIADIGDYNNDGKADLLWHSTGGSTMIWEMNGSTVLHKETVSSIGTDWHVV